MNTFILRRGLLLLALGAALSGANASRPAAQSVAQSVAQPTAQPAALQGFPTADAAATALTEAIRKDDDKAVSAMLGAGWRDFVPGTAEDEDRSRAKFLAAWDKSHRLVPAGDDRMLVEVGDSGWVSPIPLVKDGAEWRFDVEAGRREMVAREIGRNELAVIQTLLAIVDAQRDYAALDPMKTGVRAYARRLLSSPGNKDGLYWEAAPGQPDSPLGPLLAKAQPGDGPQDGYYGYRFRLLYAQGTAAPGGAHDYLVNGRMLGGFAVIATPVRYGETGVMTFIVSQSGDVYERDLGPDSAQLAAAITTFNPDSGWDKADATP
jgi:hypothetical protein